jgi:hypothetical protein
MTPGPVARRREEQFKLMRSDRERTTARAAAPRVVRRVGAPQAPL